MKNKNLLEVEALLKENNFRLTKGRIDLLLFLKSTKKPLTAKDIQEGLSISLDKVTLYRALEDFVLARIVQKVNLKNNSNYYEFINTHHHHHHIVCEKCGKIEDVEICSQDVLEKQAVAHSKVFSKVHSHSLEFFGICHSCHKV